MCRQADPACLVEKVEGGLDSVHLIFHFGASDPVFADCTADWLDSKSGPKEESESLPCSFDLRGPAGTDASADTKITVQLREA